MSRGVDGLPVGESVDWRPRPPLPDPGVLVGRTCRLESLDARHLPELWQALVVESPPSIWTYLPVGPLEDPSGLAAYVETLRATPALTPFAIVVDPEAPERDGAEPAPGHALGIAALLRDDPVNGAVEVGHLTYGTGLQRTVAATEAMHLLASYVFEEHGYRRYEWKCDALNAASRRAAERLGFTYEGTFRKAVVHKGRNRDTAWFSIIDTEWPAIARAHRAWLDPANHDEAGRQRVPLAVRHG